ncbi:ABC transporter family substrate-binding protein [Streptacidiphilus monticola]|uniref:ABC transporter family substrate-binding protein n=1 Tax=Streptacidiphilus monticola TaxID=2161674 RepID=A0ABW1G518_9ACTN
MVNSSRTRRGLSVLVCAAVALICSACTSGSGDKGASGSDVASSGGGKVQVGGTLHWAVDAVPADRDVFGAAATDATALAAEASLPTLFRLDDRARPVLDQDYLVKAEQTSASPQTIIYTLNPKAVWSDGSPLSAADFAAQWKRLAAAHSADGYDRIASVGQGADAHQVKVVFSQPFGPWRGLFTPLYPAAGKNLDAGPFTYKAQDAKALTLVRNPRWWGSQVHLDALALTAVAPAERIAALRAGAVDYADLSAAVTDSGQAPPAVAGTTLHRAAAPAYVQLTFNGATGPLADPQVRHAVADAVDRQALADAVLKPLSLPATPLGNRLLMAGQPGYRDDSAELQGGAANAAKLLDAAGWKTPANSDAAHPATRTKAAKPLALTLLTRQGSATDARLASLLTAQLAASGIQLTTRPVAAADFVNPNLAQGRFDLALFAWPASRFPVADQRALYEKPQVAVDGSVEAGQNYSGTGTDEIDSLLDRAVSALDEKQAASLANQADRRLWQVVPNLPLFQSPELVATSDTLVNAGAFGFATPDFTRLGFTKKS